MRRWRVGNLSSGIVLIILGFVLLTSLLKGAIFTEYILKLWPVVLVILGFEILIYTYFSSEEESKVKYDIFSMLMMGFIGIFSMGAYTVSTLDLIPKLSSYINRQEYTISSKDREIDIEKGIEKIIIDFPSDNLYTKLNIKCGTDSKMIFLEKGSILANSKEESEDIMKTLNFNTKRVGDALYIGFNPPRKSENFDSGVSGLEYTMFLPKDKNIEIIGNDKKIDVEGKAIQKKWVIKEASYVNIQIDSNDDVEVLATTRYDSGLNGNIKWNKESNAKENMENDTGFVKGNVKFKEGINKIYVVETNEVTVNTLY